MFIPGPAADPTASVHNPSPLAVVPTASAEAAALCYLQRSASAALAEGQRALGFSRRFLLMATCLPGSPPAAAEPY